MKINWTIVAILVPVVLMIIGWGYSIESSLAVVSSSVDLSNRVAILEELVTPLIIDYKVEQTLKNMGVDVGRNYIQPNPAPPKIELTKPHVDDIIKKAEDWTKSQIRQAP